MKSLSGLPILLVLFGAFGTQTYAKSKNDALDAQDEIKVLAHLPLSDREPVARFVETRHYRRDYLYAEHNGSSKVTLIDVTTADHPVLKAEVQLQPGSQENLVSVVGNAALIEEQPATTAGRSASSSVPTQTFRIMNLLDPDHPTVEREFGGVTAVASDDKRGLIFIANKDGVWVLAQRFAMSPQQEALQKSIEHSIYDTR